MIVCAGRRRALPDLGRLASSPAGAEAPGHERLPGGADRADRPDLGPPRFHTRRRARTVHPVQLGFVSVLSILLYGGFLFAQTIQHRSDFVEEVSPAGEAQGAHETITATLLHAVLLIVALIGIVLLAEDAAKGAENGLAAMQIAQADAIIGALIATLVLLPEALSAIRAALNNELQRSLNVALGSALATIGLTIPAIAVASLVTGRELTLGLSPGDMVLLVLILSISTQSFGTGRTTMLTGLVHLVVFVAYLLLIVVP